MTDKIGSFASPLLIKELDAHYGSEQTSKEPVDLRSSADINTVLTQIKEGQKEAAKARVSFK